MGLGFGEEEEESNSAIWRSIGISMRTRIGLGGVALLVCVGLLASPGFPLLASTLQEILGVRSEESSEVVVGLGYLQEAQLDPTGRYLGTLTDSRLDIWKVEEGSLYGSVDSPTGIPFAGFSWSPSGSAIATTDFLGRISVFTFPDLRLAMQTSQEYNYQEHSISSRIEPHPLAWSPNGSLIALGWYAGEGHVFNATDGSHIILLSDRIPPWGLDIQFLSWSPKGDRILIQLSKKGAIILDTSSGQIVKTLGFGDDEHPVEDAAYSPSGLQVALLHKGAAWFLDIDPGPGIHITVGLPVGVGGSSGRLAWSRDGGYLAVASMFGQESRLIIVDRELKVVVNRTLYFGPTTSLSWSGELLAASSQDEVTVWSFNPDQGLSLLRVFRGWGREASHLSWYPDSERFAASYLGLGQPIRVLNKEGEEVFQIIDQDLSSMYGPVVSSDGRMLAGVASIYEVRIWDTGDGRLGARFNTSQAIACLEWSPAQPRVLAVAGGEEVEIWDVTDPGQGASIRIRPGSNLNCLAWSPGGDLLAVGTHEGVEIWDVQKPLLLQAIAGPEVRTVAWSPDGARLAVLSRYLESDRKGSDPPPECRHLNLLGRVTIFSVQRGYRQSRDGAEVNVTLTFMSEGFMPWPDPSRDGGLLAWSPNSTLLAVGTGSTELITGKDPRDCPVAVQPGVLIQRIDQESGAMRTAQFLGPVIRPVSSVAWSPDCSRILAACQDATIRIWRVGPGNPPQIIGNSAVLYLALVPVLTILLHTARNRNKNRNR